MAPKNPKTSRYGFDTLAVHAGGAPDPSTGARNVPIYQNASYVFDDVDHAASLFNLQTFGYIYSRLGNPTVSALEERLAALEGGRGATATSTGHAAQLVALFPLMAPGAHIVAANKLYGGSVTQFSRTITKFGWEASFAEATDPGSFRAAIRPETRAIFVECLANPGGVVVDIEAVAEVADAAGIPLIVDNTMATPYLCRPVEWGATLVVNSLTKFLTGNGTAMGGVVVDSGDFDWGRNDKFPSLSAPEPAYHGLTFWETFGDLAFTMHAHAIGLRDLGTTLAPMNAFLTLSGLETLSLRMDRHCRSALEIATWLQSHPQVAWVSYAGLEDSPYRALAEKYLPKGAGGVFTFGVKGGYEQGVRVVEGCEIVSHLANIGDTHTLILHPASTTHRQLTDEQRVAAGAGPDVIRLSVGLEDPKDIIADLDQALKRSAVQAA